MARAIRKELRDLGLPATGDLDQITRILRLAKIQQLEHQLPGTTINPGPNVYEQPPSTGKGDLEPPINQPLTFGNVLGSGGEGITFNCRLATRDVACKVVPIIDGNTSLNLEYAWLQRLYQRGIRVPRPITKYSTNDIDIMVMEKLDHTLKAIFESNDNRFNNDEVKGIMIRMLMILERLHDNGDVFVDIKPENIMTDATNQWLYLIDPGLLYLRGQPAYGKHIGTPKYTSIDAHLGLPLGPSHDLQSLGYMAASFIRGNLPWDDLTHCNLKTRTPTFEQILECITHIKQQTTAAELAPGYPELKEYLDYVLALKSTDTPDYAYLKSLFS